MLDFESGFDVAGVPLEVPRERDLDDDRLLSRELLGVEADSVVGRRSESSGEPRRVVLSRALILSRASFN